MDLKNKQEFMFYPDITSPKFNEQLYLKREFRDNEVTEDIDLNNTNKKNIKKIQEFELDRHQVLLKNYISPDTPYNGILIFHGTGVGKTCSAISISEGFKKTLKNINKKVLILSNLKDNFKKEIFDFSKEELSKQFQNINFQCTGDSYDLGIDGLSLTEKLRKKEVYKMIKSYYEFVGYIKFANDIKKKTNNWDGEDKNITEDIKKLISKEFDDRVIIIDEIQNIKTSKKQDLEKTIQSMLEAIIKYGKNIKLILMSATPMFDRADEIIFYLNLLLENDKRKKINKSDVFNIKDGLLKKGAEELLRKYLTGYVSYIRAEKPFVFPFRIESNEASIPTIKYDFYGEPLDKKKIKYTKIICLKMHNIQNNTYIHYYNDIDITKNNKIENINDYNDDEYENITNYEENKLTNLIQSSSNNPLLSNLKLIDKKNKILKKKKINLLDNKIMKKKKSDLLKLNKDKRNIYHFYLTEISNIVYPMLKNNKLSNIGNYGHDSINYTKDNGNAGFYRQYKYIGQKKKIKFLLQNHAIFNKDTINEAPFCDEKHLKDYSIKYYSILKKIKESKGLIFIYSNLVEHGVLPLALILEQNGFTRDRIEGEEPLLDYSPNKSKGGGKREPICYLCSKNIKAEVHQNEKNKDYHPFRRAKYLLYFPNSKDIIKIQKEDALNKFSSNNNKYGEEIKIFIGTKAVSEGLDFKRIRQVHIIDPWYNLSKHSQIIGRAIRKQSHIDLLPEERNVEIFQYASLINSKAKIGNQESIDLRNYRIAENKDIIIKKINRIMKESSIDCNFFKKNNISSSKKKVKQITSSGNILNINIGDIANSSICDYENCEYKCNWTPKKNVKYPINNDTYNISFGDTYVQKCKRIIIDLYRTNSIYHLLNIEDKIKEVYPTMDNLFIYTALERLVDNKNEIILDKFNIKGYILYRGDYYIFQPLDIKRDEVPLLYRYFPMSNKPRSVSLENYDYDYPEEKKLNIFSKNKNIYDDTIKNIENKINIHKKLVKDNIKNKKFIEAVIGCVLDKLNSKNEYLFLNDLLIKYYEKSSNSSNSNNFISYIIKYYKDNNILINFYQHINYNTSKINLDKFIGYYSYGELYVFDNINQSLKIENMDFTSLKISKANEEVKNIILTHMKQYIKSKNNKLNTTQLKYGNIYGIIQSETLKKSFKIVNNIQKSKIITKNNKESQRTIFTGLTCSSYKIHNLIPLRDNLQLYNINKNKKYGKEFICNDIEITLRYYELIKKDNKIWFVFK